MTFIDHIFVKIRGRETPFWDRVYRVAKAAQSIHMPVVPVLHNLLYSERWFRQAVWHGFKRLLYYEPMFRSQCESVGRNLRLIGGIPQLCGTPLKLRIGDNVTISGVTTFQGSKVADNPVLEIGSWSHIGYQTMIVSGYGVHIGEHVLIANRVLIAGDDSHPLDAMARILNQPPEKKDVKEVWIENSAWIGEGATILKGVRIGKGAIVGTQAVVTKDVPPYSVVAGNPARVVKLLGTLEKDRR